MGAPPVAGRPAVGMPAPDFELSNQFGETVRLSALRGTPVAVLFYPFAFSGVCTGELCELRDNPDVFEAPGVRLLAVSVDHKYTLRAYAQAENYPFDLLADFWPHGAVASRYGMFDGERGFAGRGTFLIDAEGVLRSIISSAVGQARQLGEYRQAVAELGTGARAGAPAPGRVS